MALSPVEQALNDSQQVLWQRQQETQAALVNLTNAQSALSAAQINRDRCTQGSNAVATPMGPATAQGWILDNDNVVTQQEFSNAHNTCAAFDTNLPVAIQAEALAQSEYDAAVQIETLAQSQYNTSLQAHEDYLEATMSPEDQALQLTAQSDAELKRNQQAEAAAQQKRVLFIAGGIIVIVVVVLLYRYMTREA